MDIVAQKNSNLFCNGFHAEDEDEYAEAINKILKFTPKQRQEIRLKARKSVDRFSETQFSNGFLRVIEPLLKST